MVITKAENQIFGSFHVKTKDKKRLTNNILKMIQGCVFEDVVCKTY